MARYKVVQLDINSLFFAMVAISFTVALITGAVAYRNEFSGLSEWSWALALHGVAYSLFLLRDQVSNWLSIVLANVSLASVLALFTLGVCGFQRRRLSPWIVWSPVGALAVLFVLFIDDTGARIVVLGVVTVVQSVMVLALLLKGRHTTPGRGQYFLMGAITIIAAMLALRAMMVGSGVVQVATLQSTNSLQSMTFLVSMICIITMGQGLVLMSAERAVHRNLHLAIRDELTGLSSRRFVLDSLEQQLALGRRMGHPLSVLVVDADHFKRVNDTHGHLVGDRMLRHLAAKIQARLRSYDVAGRYGGEEFLIVLPHTGVAAAIKVAESLRQTISETPLVLGPEQSLGITVSIGVAECTDGSAQAEQLIHWADAALYRAKAGGRNRVEAAPPDSGAACLA